MKKALIATAVLALIFAGVTLQTARADNSQNTCTKNVTVLEATDLTSSRTFTASSGGFKAYGLMSIYMDHNDVAGSITRIDTACSGVGPDGNTYALQYCDVSASGVCTSADQTWQKTFADGDARWVTRVDIESVTSLSCTVSAGAGVANAADIMTITAQLCVK